MTTKKLKDGIYSISPTRSNPFAKYALIKTFPNGEVKQRFLETIQDCKQQLAEWNYELGITSSNVGTHRARANHYYLYDAKSGESVFDGSAKEVAEKFNRSMITVCNCANEGRRFCNKYLIYKNNPVATLG